MISKASRFSLNIGGVLSIWWLLSQPCLLTNFQSEKKNISTKICAFWRPVLNKNTSVLVSIPSEATLDIQTPAERVFGAPQNIPETNLRSYLDV